ncbi:MAG: transcriptional repressor [Clostridia bacterium]|nr:transcriptional repressor [Clostridia bacterium]
MQRGNYQTRQQEAVAALFERSPEACMTADEAYRKLLDTGMDVGKTTVYRAMTKLCDAGVLRRYAPQSSSEAAQYQYNPCRESHLHIRCASCGAMEHLHCDEVEAFAAHIRAHHGFQLDEGRTLLCGLCESCAQKQGKGAVK